MKTKPPKKANKRRRSLILFFAAFALVVSSAVLIYGYTNMNYDKSVPTLLMDSGFIEKQATLSDGTVINYGEGPLGGTPLLLIHGQMVSWEDYAKVLSGLSEYYHVYAIDCYGHGESSKNPDKYTANAMGNDLIWFIENVIGEPTVISGHSSGGLLAAWLAANAPDKVKGIVIEDAPFFSTEAGRYEKTYAWMDGFKTIHLFLNQTAETNYTRFYLERCYIKKYWGNGWEKIVVPASEDYFKNHPNEGLRLWFLPASMNKAFDLTKCVQNGNGSYDLRFGDAFYDGAWFAGFNQEETLKKIKCPSILLHTASSYDEEGILLGAMDYNDAMAAHELMKGNELIDDIKSGHDIHDEKPSFFINVMENFWKRLQQ